MPLIKASDVQSSSDIYIVIDKLNEWYIGPFNDYRLAKGFCIDYENPTTLVCLKAPLPGWDLVTP